MMSNGKMDKIKKITPGRPQSYLLKMGTKKGKATPGALEATLPVIFHPLDFVWISYR
jgi:hypothetical protein